MKTLFIATGNAHKIAEIQSILGDRFEYHSLRDFPDAPNPVEDAETFAGNAKIKSKSLAAWLILNRRIESGGSAVLADDSGLEVRTLAWAPGAHSARFAALDSGKAGNSADSENNAKLLRLLGCVPHDCRHARFRCVLALTILKSPYSTQPTDLVLEAQTQCFEGRCEGRIDLQASGVGGFGYDPLFIPDGYDHSFAELGSDVKNKLSHRARALEQLKCSGILHAD